jgi:hypothetical protein
MNYRNNLMSPEEGTATLPAPKSPGKRFVRSLEYDRLAYLTLQNFGAGDEPDFAGLLAIPLSNRIPALIREYGMKRMHQMIRLILKEFCYSSSQPKAKKLTDTRIAVCACDLMLAAHEDQLSLEDLIVFFERAKAGKQGNFKKPLTHYSIMEQLEEFRQKRHEVLLQIRRKQEEEHKAFGAAERTCSEPTAILNLFGPDGLRKIS